MFAVRTFSMTVVIHFVGSLAWAQQIETVAAPTADSAQAATSSSEGETKASAADVALPPLLVARCADGSSLKLRLIDATITLNTDYGLLEIPTADIVGIDFATRQQDGVPDRVKAAIEKLGDNDYDIREAASTELLSLAEAAYPALVAIAEDGGDAEAVHRAELLIEQIKETIREEDLETRDDDLIYTRKSQISGTIDRASLKVETGLFGEQQLRLIMLRRISDGSADEQIDNVLPDPGSLSGYQQQVGKTFYFRLASAIANNRNTNVWGTEIYTLDSSLSRAAIHAGLLKPGETKVIGVTIMGPQQSFVGSVQNGITSSNYAAFPGGFKFKTKSTRGTRPGCG